MKRLPDRRVSASMKWDGFAQVRADYALNATLHNLDLMRTLKEPEFQELVELASEICATPISLISLLDEEKQWVTSSVGLDLEAVPLEVSFCSHAIKTPNIFVLEDATKDDRFKNNPFVDAVDGVRFYAGIPLSVPGGAPFGTLCVVDTKAREMSARERKALAILGRQVRTRLELRAKQQTLEAANDVNERLSATLQESNDLFLTFMQNAPLASYIKDAEGRMVFYNQELADRFGVDTEVWIGQTNHDLWPKEVADQFYKDELRIQAEGVRSVISEISPDGNGGTIHWKSYKFPFQNRKGEVLVAGMSLDVTADVEREQSLAEAMRQLEVLARTDSVTGLANRRVFEARAQEAFSEARKHREPMSLLVLDIDDFKRRNDEFGHAAGDEALRLIGAMLAERTGGELLASRIGGEEFAVVLPGMDGRAALWFAEETREMLLKLESGSAKITASIGVAALDATVSSWQRLLARADDAMYDAKRRGKDKVVLHEELVQRLRREAQTADAEEYAGTGGLGFG